ncbi:MAG: CinA family nicotinamide mononucleotide deamidase-related protein [Candidatus Amulumruptor caecigallinarius]|nr:CinA family nicotinamide mononucleotide deamidase-related protein [Candidatus Amulumruptor caecigallinarius]MCM1396705.1 CinA family nicotinamide mononucleotide deamidase-related protein [Candidatus Amulumruptor caecigallinarius]MCM1453237.1 CinA family nicotinamide mononucleotide deamidase-related protein [bacterium]
MDISIIAIGDELLLGQVTDTNSSAIARMIDPLGWRVRGVEVVHDDAAAIRAALDRALAASDVTLLTGGLGPTKDDITKGTLAAYFGGGMHLDEAVLANVAAVMAAGGRELNDLTRGQAMVPDACRVIQNEVGTAPLMWFERDGKVVVSMPGVPHETLTMMERSVIPMLQERFPSNLHISHRVALVADLSESRVAMALEDWEDSLPANLHIAYLPKARLIRLRLDGTGPDAEALEAQLDSEFAKMTAILGPHVIARRDIPLPQVLVESAREAGVTLATAESCTGGNIAHEITMVAGCSDVMLGGVVSYANAVKTSLLGVNADTLAEHGAVSEQTVEEMLRGVTSVTGATLVLATSGIAGPGGGTPEKPVGTVVIGVMRAGQSPVIATHHFGGGRARVIEQATAVALTQAIHLLQGNMES